MTPKLHTEASTNDLIKIDAPEIVELEVEQVVYTTHHKQDRPPIMKVMYYCGLRMFNEYICIEHEGYARKKAVQWWEKHRAPLLVPCPDTTERALELAPRLLVPKKLRVWINKEFPEILDHLELHQQEEPEGDPYGMGAQQTIRSDELEDDEIPF